MGFYQRMTSDGGSVFQAADALTAGINAATWPDDNKVQVLECVAAFSALIASPAVTMVSKAVSLLTSFDNLHTSSQCLVDVRPIFAEPDKGSIVAGIVTYTLRLKFESENGDERTVSIVLDGDDLRALQKQCEEGLKKAGVLAKTMQERWGLPVFSQGDDDGAS
jgi:hypothetical protein